MARPKLPRVRTATGTWKITRLHDKRNYGSVDYRTYTINVRPKLKGSMLLETVLHEGLHVLFPFLSEDAVTCAGHDLTKLVTKFGVSIGKETLP